jgi:hypothetical protein
MNNLESIIEMWKKDSVIDEMNLGDASRESAKLHSKYLELYSINKLKLKKLDLDFKVLLRDKFMHYRKNYQVRAGVLTHLMVLQF